MSPRAVHTAYYIAHGAKSLLWTASDLVTIYALVSLNGVDPSAAGWLLLTGLGANASADFVVGAWLARHPGGTPQLAGAGLAHGLAGIAMTAVLGPGPTFASGDIMWLAGGTIAARVLAAVRLAASSRLTPPPVDRRRGA